jgi:hypothetical protein
MIIPLGPGSLRDSSSLPEGRSAALFRGQHIRAGPALPSYLALLHAGFSVPRMLPPGRWALTPPFHPCQMNLTERGQPLVLPQACRRGASVTGGLFSVVLSVAALARTAFAKRTARPPGVTRRVALSSPALARLRRWSPDFPPVRFPCEKRTGDHPAHPPFQIIPCRLCRGTR